MYEKGHCQINFNQISSFCSARKFYYRQTLAIRQSYIYRDEKILCQSLRRVTDHFICHFGWPTEASHSMKWNRFCCEGIS